jgi:hypothetical protein
VIRREGPLPTMIDEGPDEFKGRGFEILLVEVEVWCEVPEFAAQS